MAAVEELAQELDSFLMNTFRKLPMNGGSGNRINIDELQGDDLKENEVPEEPFPVKGALGLSRKQIAQLQQSWDEIGDNTAKEAFVAKYFCVLFALEAARKPFKIPVRPPSGKTLEQMEVFKHHVFLQNMGWEGVFSTLGVSEENFKRFAQGVGMRHRKFEKVVIFEDWLWNHLIDSWMTNLKAHKPDLDEKMEKAWKRLAIWFFSNMHNTYVTKSVDYDKHK